LAHALRVAAQDGKQLAGQYLVGVFVFFTGTALIRLRANAAIRCPAKPLPDPIPLKIEFSTKTLPDTLARRTRLLARLEMLSV
jgi:hypothetical protein